MQLNNERKMNIKLIKKSCRLSEKISVFNKSLKYNKICEISVFDNKK